MIENPKQGLLEPEDLDHDFVLDVCRPYLGKVVAARCATGRRSEASRGAVSRSRTWTGPIPGSSGISG